MRGNIHIAHEAASKAGSIAKQGLEAGLEGAKAIGSAISKKMSRGKDADKIDSRPTSGRFEKVNSLEGQSL